MKSMRYFPLRRAHGMTYVLAAATGVVVLAGCGGGSTSSPANTSTNSSTSEPPPTYSVGGTISGLTSSGLALSDNGGAALSIPANATSFSFPATSAATFNVVVSSQPNNPALSCAVSNGSGTVGQANVTKVKVLCVPYQAVGGGVANLLGSGLSLSINGGAPLSITGNGPFSFPTQLPQGTAYSVKIVQQPTSPSQTCSLTNGSGTVPTSNVSSVAVYCPKPVGNFVYVSTDFSLYAFAIVASSGALLVDGDPIQYSGSEEYIIGLSPESGGLYFGTPGHPAGTGCSRNGCQPYAATQATISLAGIDSVTRALTGQSQSLFGSLGTATNSPQLAIAPSGRFGYVTGISDGNIATFALDPQNDTDVAPVTPVLSQGGAPTSQLVISPSGTVAANITSEGLTTYQLNTQTGAVNAVAPITGAASYQAPVIEPTGRFLYATTASEITAFAIDPATAAITRLQGGNLSAAAGWSIEALYMSPAGTYLYALLWNSGSATGQISAYAIDSGTGLLTAASVPPLPITATNIVMVFDPSGSYVYVSDDFGPLLGFGIDAATGAFTAVPNNPQYSGQQVLSAIVSP